MESMRLSPAFAFSLPQCTATAKKIGPMHVPAGTAVVIDAARLNSDPETWGPDAAAFNPARFAQVSSAKSRYGFMRFGVGGASGRCLGRNIADFIFKLVAMEVVGRFELAVPGDEGRGIWCFLLEGVRRIWRKRRGCWCRV
jgi:cytochrome P450